MSRESSREILLRHRAALQERNAGFNSPPSDNPFQHIADDGSEWPTHSEMVARNLNVRSENHGREVFKRTQNRYYRRA